jgi:hypothetical protein
MGCDRGVIALIIVLNLLIVLITTIHLPMCHDNQRYSLQGITMEHVHGIGTLELVYLES